MYKGMYSDSSFFSPARVELRGHASFQKCVCLSAFVHRARPLQSSIACDSSHLYRTLCIIIIERRCFVFRGLYSFAALCQFHSGDERLFIFFEFPPQERRRLSIPLLVAVFLRTLSCTDERTRGCHQQFTHTFKQDTIFFSAETTRENHVFFALSKFPSGTSCGIEQKMGRYRRHQCC